MSTSEQLREMEALLFADVVPTRLVGESLIAAAGQALGGVEVDLAAAGWQLLAEMVLGADPIDERGRHPYVAARHLLGLVEYPTDPRQEIPFAQGRSWNALKGTWDFPHAPPSFPLTQSRRLVLAALGGGYGKDRTLWVVAKRSRPQLVKRITDDFIATLDALSLGRRHETATPAAGADPPGSSSTVDGSEIAAGTRSRRTKLWLGAICVFAVAGLWLVFSPNQGDDSAGLGSQKPVPSNKLSSYWRAGWGPDRPTFTVDSAATYPVFNSITDNSEFGDERNFVNVRHVESEKVWFDDLWAEPGDELLMRVFVSNSGYKNTGSDPLQEAIQQARVELGLSEGDGEWSVFGTLSAVNAEEVWDGATIHTDPGVEVVMDASTAKVETNAGTRDLPAEAFDREGALLGYEQADGFVRPLYAESAYVTVRLRVVQSETKPGDEYDDDEPAETEATKYRGGWGPERKMYSIEKPAKYTVLNSLEDNPALGDERNFVRVKHLGETNASYTDVIGARAGDELVVYAYVDNGASDNLGIAAAVHGLTAQLYLPDEGTDHSLAVTYEGENAAEVWDGVSVIAPEPTELTYVSGSAEFFTPSARNGSYKPKDLEFEAGNKMMLGHLKQDGLLPVGRDDENEIGNGYLTFRVTVNAASS